MKMMSLKKIVLTMSFGLTCALFSSAQYNTDHKTPDIEWGELTRKQGRLLYLLPSGENEFYALRWSGGRLFGGYKVTKHKNLELVASAKVRLVAEQSIANFEGASVINGRFVIFLSDKKDGKNHFYMQEFDENLKKKDEIIHLASYDLDRNQRPGSFRFRASPNRKYFGVIWEVPGKKETRDIYGFKIFDLDMNLINEGEYKLPYDPDLSTIHDHLISNAGDYFICVSEFEQSERRTLFSNRKEYKALHIYRLNDDLGLQDFTLDLDGRPVVALAMSSSEENTFTLTGIYSNVSQSGVAGVFYQKLNLDTEEVIQEGFQEFEEEFITQGWSERSLRRAQRRKEQGKGDPELYSYTMRDVTFLDDGSIVGTMEQYYVQVRSNADGRIDQSSNMYYYYYNDIIAYKIDTVGNFSWVKKIEKDQVSINDGGPYSSFESFVDDGRVYFIFNDNINNYDANGQFLNPERLSSANYSKRRNAVSLTSIDLESGESVRTNFLQRDDNKSLVVPKLFTVNYRTGELLIYSVSGQREKIGVIDLK
jgi:hypothetical protein